jgi:LssY C-terminus
MQLPPTSLKQIVRNCSRLGWMLALPLAAQTAPPARIEARLLTPVSSYTSKSGADISAMLATRVCFADGSKVAEGATVRGRVQKVHKVGLGLIHETAGMTLVFDHLQLPDGRLFPVEVRLRSIDNARERVDSRSGIHGIRATDSLSNRAGERLAFLAMGHPAAILPLFAVETALFRFPDPEIYYGPGAELQLDIKLPTELGEAGSCDEPQATAEQTLQLDQLVTQLPAWSYSLRQHQAMDLVNLVFAGSEEQLKNAFRAAGWSKSQRNTMWSGFGAIRAIAEAHGDTEAPMRTLLLDGAEPDCRLQKSLNTFQKRHHLRIWKRDAAFEGRQVWASAATRDVSATFSMRPFGFTHQIEDAVDRERDKVVNDLRFTGCVDAVYYVPRSNLADAFEGDYRRGVHTDGKVAVVVLNECRSARLEFVATLPAPPPEPLVVRTVRRVTLTARNHFLRDNIFYRSADGVRLAWLTVRNWSREFKEERVAKRERAVILAKAAVASTVATTPPPSR